jgi:acid stress chaperone HdeB
MRLPGNPEKRYRLFAFTERHQKVRDFMRVDLVALGFVLTLFSTTLVQGQVTVDVSKVTCDQFAQGKVGLPRTTAVWLNGYYHGKKGTTTIDTEQSEAIFMELMDFCRTGENGKVLIMQAIERALARSK